MKILSVRRETHRGFTVIELLVVIAIIAVLIGLLLPAVQKVREAASRLRCQNNLKQIGLGLHNFNSTVGGFPMMPYNPSFAWLTVKPYSEPHGWCVELLPYIEQQNLYNQYDWNVAWNSGTNLAVIETPLNIYVCPSTATDANRPSTGNLGNGNGALDYIGFFNVYSCPWNQANIADYVAATQDANTGSGFMGRGVNRRVEEILDGTSNTLLLGEDAGRNATWIMGRNAGQGADNTKSPAGAWGNYSSGASFDYLHFWNPFTMSYGGPVAVNGDNAGDLYSFHPGGANVLMGDGSVQFLTTSVSVNTVAALFTRAGGETVPNQ